MKFRTIQIDFDVHKRIESERRDFSETENTVLRRLLGLPEAANPDEPPSSEPVSVWSRDGATLPDGTLLRMTYNGQVIEGQVAGGAWLVNGQKHTSPSGAAAANVRSKQGHRVAVDGWAYWYVRRPTDADYIPLAGLRKNQPTTPRRVPSPTGEKHRDRLRNILRSAHDGITEPAIIAKLPDRSLPWLRSELKKMVERKHTTQVGDRYLWAQA